MVRRKYQNCVGEKATETSRSSMEEDLRKLKKLVYERIIQRMLGLGRFTEGTSLPLTHTYVHPTAKERGITKQKYSDAGLPSPFYDIVPH